MTADRFTALNPPTEMVFGRMGNGTAVHVLKGNAILCNAWGSTNGTWKAPKRVVATAPTCRRCVKLAGL